MIVPVILLGALPLIAFALWNGYPFVYFDTTEYISGHKSRMRTPVYGQLVGLTAWTGTLWTIALLQALLVSSLWYRFCALIWGRTCNLAFLATMVLLAALTPLPWVAMYIMSDMFIALMVISTLLLAFYRDEMAHWEIFGHVILVTFCSAAHLSNPGVLAVLVLSIFLIRRQWADWRLPGLAFLLSVLVLIGGNWMNHGKADLTVSGDAFLLGRFADDGTLGHFLEESCESEAWRLCPYRDQFPMRSWVFLWSDDSPFQKVGGWSNDHGEYRRLVVSIIAHDFPAFLGNAMDRTLEQLFKFDASHLVSVVDSPYPTDAIRQHFPADFEAYSRSRQARNLIAADTMATTFLVSTYTGMALLLVLAAAWGRTLEPRMSAMAVLSVLSILATAIICGTVSEAMARYLTRIAWLAPGICLVMVSHMVIRSRKA